MLKFHLMSWQKNLWARLLPDHESTLIPLPPRQLITLPTRALKSASMGKHASEKPSYSGSCLVYLYFLLVFGLLFFVGGIVATIVCAEAYSWLCAQRSILIGLEDHMGCQSSNTGLIACKGNVLFVLSLFCELMQDSFQMFTFCSLFYTHFVVFKQDCSSLQNPFNKVHQNLK